MALQLQKSPYFTERTFRNYRDRFTVCWILTRDCNFKCCYDAAPEGHFQKLDVPAFASELKKLGDMRLVITGGEPLMCENIIELCQEVGKFGRVEMQTNFSLKTKEFIDRTDPKYIELILTTFHPEARRVWGGEAAVKDYIDSINYAKSKGFRVIVYMIDYPKYSEEYFLEQCKTLYDAGIVPERKRYVGDECGGRIGDAIYVTGKMCNASHRSFMMLENYDIVPCETYRWNMGNLFTGYKLSEGPIKCGSPFCGCLGRENIMDEYKDEFYGRSFGAEYVK